MKHFTLSFHPGTETAVTGTKSELIAELQNLIDEIDALDEDEHDTIDPVTVTIYDLNGTDFIEARLEEI